MKPYVELPLEERIRRIKEGMAILCSRPVVELKQYRDLREIRMRLEKRKERQACSK